MFKDQEPSRPTILPLVIEFTDLTFSAPECDCDPFISVPYTNWNWVQNFPLKAVVDRAVSMVDRLISDTSPLANFQSVHVRCPPLSTAFWKHVMGQLQDLRYLKLSRATCQTWLPCSPSPLTITRRIRMVTQIEVQIGYLHLHWRSWSCVASYFRQSRQTSMQ